MTRMTMVCALVLGAVAWAGDTADAEARVKELQGEVQSAEKATRDLKKELATARRDLQAAKAGGPGDVAQTQFHLPYLAKAPIIDGVVNDDEWAGAIVVPLTTGIFGMMERSSSTFFIGWDEENLYFGQRLPMREGEVPLRLNREPKHDNVYCGETSLEVYVDRKSSGSHPSRCRWQFMGNAVGNRWDREDQFEIGQNFIGWDGDWQYRQRLTPDGKVWEAEIAIPRRTVYQEQPLKDGDLWWIGLASNLHRPWCFSGFYQWRIPATFTKSTPEIRLYNPQRSLEVRGIAAELKIRNTTAQAFAGEVVARLSGKPQNKVTPVVFEKRWAATVDPGKTLELTIAEPVGEAAADRSSYQLSIMVLQGDESVYTWSYPIRYNDPANKEGLDYTPEPAPFILHSFYNPLADYVRVVVDKYDFAQRDAAVKARFTIRPEGGGESLGTGEVDNWVYGKAQTEVPTPADLAAGTYECVAELIAADGKVLATHQQTFVRKDHAKEFPWLDNTIGEDDIVCPPFEPLAVAGTTIAAYKKQIEIGGDALPAQIHAAGVDLLGGPIALRGAVGGQAFATKAGAAPVNEGAGETQANFRGTAAGGPLAVTVASHWEYDSTAKVTLTLTPATKGPVKLDHLQLVIPFKAASATHFMANGLNMRLSNVAGNLPAKPEVGTVWDSTSVPYQKMTVGSFIPIVWLGNLNSGMTWFADTDKGWWPGDAKPAIEIVRAANGNVELVLNLAGAPVELAGSRTIEFGLNVNPVRPYSLHLGSSMTFGFLEETGRWDPKVTKSKVFARRYPDNLELNKRYIDASHRLHEIYAPYTEMSWKDFYEDEANYFHEEWRSQEEGGNVLKCESANDCLLYWTKRWIDDAGLDGYYFDNVFNRLNWNTRAGTAYALPDGRIQPGYELWGMRSQIKRIRTLLGQTRPRFRICIHNTRYQFAPIMGFADLAMGGEMATPTMGSRDFMDMYPRDFMDVMYNVPLWGYQLSHLYHFRNKTWVDEMGEYDRDAAMLAHRTAMATMLVHGVEFFQGIDYQPFLMTNFRMLRKIAPDLAFTPSWQAAGRWQVLGDQPDVDAAIWGDGRDVLLLVVANYSEHKKNAMVRVDFPSLLQVPGDLEQRECLDFETMAFAGYYAQERPEFTKGLPRLGDFNNGHGTITMANTLRIPVEPRNFRALLFINLPVAKGAGF